MYFLEYGMASSHTWATATQIEGYWKYYNHLVRPHDLPNTSDYHLFKEGIKPMWEVRTAARHMPNSGTWAR